MPQSIKPVRLNHLNVVLEDFDASVVHLRDNYGAEFMHDYPTPVWHACLVNMAHLLFEFFVPPQFLLNTKYGPHYLGVEYQADMEEVRASVAEHGIRIARDIGSALHTHPTDTFGVAYEFWDGYFHDSEWPLLGRPIQSLDAARNKHPLGLTGFHGYSHAVRDIDAAQRFLQSFLSAQPVHEAGHDILAARGVGLHVANGIVELLAPQGEGGLSHFLERSGEGIRSAIFTVRDIDEARRHLEGQGLELVPGFAPDSLAVPASANLGIMFEFIEGETPAIIGVPVEANTGPIFDPVNESWSVPPGQRGE